jgi:hypothetical protein
MTMASVCRGVGSRSITCMPSRRRSTRRQSTLLAGLLILVSAVVVPITVIVGRSDTAAATPLLPTWSLAGSISGLNDVRGFSCSSENDCVAVGVGNPSAVSYSTDGGVTWTPSSSPAVSTSSIYFLDVAVEGVLTHLPGLRLAETWCPAEPWCGTPAGAAGKPAGVSRHSMRRDGRGPGQSPDRFVT